MKAATCYSLMALLALSACSDTGAPDPAQPPMAPDQAQPQAAQAPGIEVSTEGDMTTITTAGNLQSTFDIGCVDMAQVKNVYSPADLFKGSVACFQAGDGAHGAGLFRLALVYGRYDIDRVADRTAHQGLEVLKLSSFEPFSEADKTLIQEQLNVFFSSPEANLQFCAQLRALGPPAYHPDYMIQHGMQAFQPWSQEGINGLVADFDPDATWQMVVDRYMRCASDADVTASTSPDPDADQNTATKTDAATRVREAPSLAASARTAVAEYFNSEGTWPESNAQAGIAESSPQFPVSIGPGGVITIHFDEPAELVGKSIVLTPRSEASGDWVDVYWSCSAVDIPVELRSQNCP